MVLQIKGTLSAEDIDRAYGNGRQATFVDGVMRWVDKNGQPGEKITGNFDFVQRGSTYTLFPSEDRPTSTVSRRKRTAEEEQKLAR